MALKDLGVIEEASMEELEELRRDAENIAWWNEHAHEFETRCRGKHLTVINKEVFVGDSYDEVYEQAKAKYPDEEPFVDHIPYKKEILILQQFETGRGDYSIERHFWLGELDVQTLAGKIQQRRQEA